MMTYFNPRGAGQLSWRDLPALDHRKIVFRGSPVRVPTHIIGIELCGFNSLFERFYGTVSADPIPTITPTFVGASMLPFRCPKCKRPAQELACPVTREKYHDARGGHDNHHCPNPVCEMRFKINMDGRPLPCTIRAGATVGPSLVEWNGKKEWQDRGGILGWITGTADYGALANRS